MMYLIVTKSWTFFSDDWDAGSREKDNNATGRHYDLYSFGLWQNKNDNREVRSKLERWSTHKKRELSP